MDFTPWSRWKWQFVIVLLSLSLKQVFLQPSPIFTRTCDDPLVVGHMASFDHTYCFHACGYLFNILPDTATCSPNGNCICSSPVCSDAPFQMIFSDLCPPMRSDPPDPDPNAAAQCSTMCASDCANGLGIICGEIETLGPANNVFAKICTCHCPPPRCTATTTTTTTTTTTPATIIDITNNITNTVIMNPAAFILPPFIMKKKFKIKLILKKLLKLCWFLIKMCVLYLIKCVLITLYYFAIHSWIEWEYTEFSRIIRSGFDSMLALSNFNLE